MKLTKSQLKEIIRNEVKSIQESIVVNKWKIESHHIGLLQKGHMGSYSTGTSIPFSLVSNISGVSNTDKSLVQKYIDENHIVLQFYPIEDTNNNTIRDAIKSGGVKVITTLIKKQYDLKLIKILKGTRHCSDNGQLCSVSHYLVFSN
jgi:hypothetical protein